MFILKELERFLGRPVERKRSGGEAIVAVTTETMAGLYGNIFGGLSDLSMVASSSDKLIQLRREVFGGLTDEENNNLNMRIAVAFWKQNTGEQREVWFEELRLLWKKNVKSGLSDGPLYELVRRLFEKAEQGKEPKKKYYPTNEKWDWSETGSDEELLLAFLKQRHEG